MIVGKRAPACCSLIQADPTTPIRDRLNRGAAQDVDEATRYAIRLFARQRAALFGSPRSGRVKEKMCPGGDGWGILPTRKAIGLATRATLYI
jgi:hypothetical protein